MPKDVENCVSEMHGTNKRTGKPFTQSEKWAICTAMHKRKMESSLTDEQITEDINNRYFNLIQKVRQTKPELTYEESISYTEALLAKSEYNFDNITLFSV